MWKALINSLNLIWGVPLGFLAGLGFYAIRRFYVLKPLTWVASTVPYNAIIILVYYLPVFKNVDRIWVLLASATLYEGVHYAVLFNGAINDVLPKNIREAAELDGCSPWRRFWVIEFPLMMKVGNEALSLRAVEGVRGSAIASVIGYYDLCVYFQNRVMFTTNWEWLLVLFAFYGIIASALRGFYKLLKRKLDYEVI